MPKPVVNVARALLAWLILVGLMAGCAASPRSAGASWRARTVTLRGLPPLNVTGMTAVSPRDVWVVGNADSGSVVMRWNGTLWRRVLDASLATGAFYGIAATSARDAWIVGSDDQKIAIRHWNGTRWQGVSLPRLPGYDKLHGVAAVSELHGVAAVSARDVWAVGDMTGKTGPRPLIMHWNGTVWTQIPCPAPPRSGLDGVAAVSAHDAWAVGYNAQHTLIEHWNGTVWTRVPSPAPISAAASLLTGVTATSGHDAWAVGRTLGPKGGSRALIERWDGAAWKQVPSPDLAGSELYSISAASAHNIWAVGWRDGPRCLIEHWNGSTWRRVASPDLRYCFLGGLAIMPGGSVWAAGSSSAAYRLLIVRLARA